MIGKNLYKILLMVGGQVLSLVLATIIGLTVFVAVTGDIPTLFMTKAFGG